MTARETLQQAREERDRLWPAVAPLVEAWKTGWPATVEDLCAAAYLLGREAEKSARTKKAA